MSAEFFKRSTAIKMLLQPLCILLLAIIDARDIYPNNKIAMSGTIDPLIVLAFSFKAEWVI